MAEAWRRYLEGDQIEVDSAGAEPHGLNPRSDQVMVEAGVDISGHPSKLVHDLHDIEFDYSVEWTPGGLP